MGGWRPRVTWAVEWGGGFGRDQFTGHYLLITSSLSLVTYHFSLLLQHFRDFQQPGALLIGFLDGLG